VRLKAAENALRDGSLDEAFRLASAPDLRKSRRAVAVLASVGEKLLERARKHFKADQFTEALTDLDKAETCGVKLDEIAEMKDYVVTVATEAKRQETSRQQRLRAAKKRIEVGSLSAGRKIIESAIERDAEAKRLAKSIDRRREQANALVQQSQRQLDQGQTSAAVERLLAAKQLDTHDEAVAAMETQICKVVLGEARQAIQQGRLNRAADQLANLRSLGESDPLRRELMELLTLARSAGDSLRRNRYADARREAMALGRCLPAAKWVDKTIKQLKMIDELDAELKAGPLADLIHQPQFAEIPPSGTGFQPVKSQVRNLCYNETVAIPAASRNVGSRYARLLLLVDGAGSFLVLRKDRVSIGRAVSDQPADVPIFSDLAQQHAQIARVDEDYFLFSQKEVQVAGKTGRQQLLRNGDRVVLGRRAKFEFRLPSRKSLTAVLTLSDTTKMPNDVRHVILFHEHATIGNSSTTHIRCRNAQQSLVFFEREGGLWVRPGGRVAAADQSPSPIENRCQKVVLDRQIEMCGVSFVLVREG